MLQIGRQDSFEREYVGKFRALVAAFGEVVTYERDRGARDIGVHLTRRLPSGNEVVSAALCWFQLKGFMETTLSREDFESQDEIRLSLEVRHLRYWFLQPVPTYLALYVASVDAFLVLNLGDYIATNWGPGILALEQESATVRIPRQSRLDDQAFGLIMAKSDGDAWAKALGKDELIGDRCYRDYQLVWHLGSAAVRGVRHRVIFWDWQSKTRGQFWFQEISLTGGPWIDLREHWQYMMGVEELEEAYPYVEFFDPKGDDVEGYPDWLVKTNWNEDDAILGEPPKVELRNGDAAPGLNCMDEYFKYVFGARLNDLGWDLYESVGILQKAGLIEVTPGQKENVSVAPWHYRAV